MNCRTSRELIHLDRPGERTERESAALVEHLSGCAACRAEAEKAGSWRDLERAMREASMPLPDLTDLRASILRATAAPTPRSLRSPSAPRLAYALALGAAVMWFGADQWRVHSAHAALARRVEVSPPPAFGPQIVYSIDTRDARRLNAMGARIPASIFGDEKVEVPQSTAQDWLEDASTFLAGTLARRPAQRAQISNALKALQSVVDVTIRYRPEGA